MAVGRAEITVVADASEFDRQMRRMADSMARAFRGADRESTRSFGNAEASARRFGNTMGDVQGRMARLRQAFSEGLDQVETFAASMGPLGGRVAGIMGAMRQAEVDTSGFGNALRGAVGIVGRLVASSAMIGTLAGALGAAAASAIQLAAALAPAAGAVAALPAVIGVAAGAIATLQVATMGVGDAFTAAATGDAEAFATSLEGLAPSAAAAATALRTIAPGFQALQQSVQQAFFTGFDQMLLTISSTLLGPLQIGMTAAAEGLAGITTRLGEAVTSGAGLSFVQSSFAALSNILANIREPLGLLVEAFLSLGASINIAFGGETAGAALGAMIEQFATFINRAADSGAAIGWVEGAIAVFQQLGAIISPIVGILGTVGEVAARTGGNILGAMGGALESVNAFLSSASGMSTLAAIFQTLNAVGAVFGSVLSGLLPVVAPLVGELVSGLLPVLQSLVPVVVQIGALAAPIFSQILAAVLPLVPPLLSLVSLVLPMFATLLSSLVSAAAPLLEVLVTLLVSVLTPLLPALEPILAIFGELALVLADILVPVFELIGTILTWLVENVIVPIVVRLKDKWDEQAFLMRVAWQLVSTKFKEGWNFIKTNVFEPLKAAGTAVKDKLAGIWDSVKSKFQGVVDKFKSGKDKIVNALNGIWSGVKGAYNALASGWNRIDIEIGPFSIPDWVPGVGGNTFHIADIIPNIPTLRESGFSFGTGLVNLHPNEAIVNTRDPRGLRMLADAFDRTDNRGDGGIVFETGAFNLTFAGALPTDGQARSIGRRLGEGIAETIATRRARQGVRNL